MARPLREKTIPFFRDTDLHMIVRANRRQHLFAPTQDDSAPERRKKKSRRHQLQTRLNRMADAFPMKIYGYAFMGNHFHVCMTWQPTLALDWSATDIASRWWDIHPNKRREREEWIAEMVLDSDWIEATRKKLMQIGQFSKDWKQTLAQTWNLEDKMGGSVFNKHYATYPVQGESHRLAVMAYIGLNEFAAGICDWPEQCKHSSLGKRIEKAIDTTTEADIPRLVSLKDALPSYGYEGYLKFIDAYSRKNRDGKRSVASDAPSIFQRIQQAKALTQQIKTKLNKTVEEAINTTLDTFGELLENLQKKYLHNEPVRLQVGWADWQRQMAQLKAEYEANHGQPPG